MPACPRSLANPIVSGCSQLRLVTSVSTKLWDNETRSHDCSSELVVLCARFQVRRLTRRSSRLEQTAACELTTTRQHGSINRGFSVLFVMREGRPATEQGLA